MIKQLGFISVAALSLAAFSALSACDGQPKPAPAPTETKAVTPQAVETIQVDPVAVQRLKTMYGSDLGEVLGGPAMKTPNEQTIAPAAHPAVDEVALKAAVHKSGQVIAAPVMQSKTPVNGGGQ